MSKYSHLVPQVREMASKHSVREIAATLGMSDEQVRRLMVWFDIPRLPAKARPDRNYFWKGGRVVDVDGYVLVKQNDHPHATKAGYVREHRLVMERELGRYLDPTEVVDHIDGNTSNNDPRNLRLFASNAEHLRVTLKGKCPKWTPETLAMQETWLAQGREKLRLARMTQSQPDAST